MIITIDDLSGPEIKEFLEEHIEDMKSVSPPESKHALDLESLNSVDITFWSMWSDKQLVGCAALKQLSRSEAEIKSMRVSPTCRGTGIASKLLQHVLNHARSRNYFNVYLETGSMPFFLPARSLYRKFGFNECPPFSNYKEDPNSVFMTINLKPNKISTCE